MSTTLQFCRKRTVDLRLSLTLKLLTPPKKVMFPVYLSDCEQDYGKTAGPMFMKLGGRVYQNPRRKPPKGLESRSLTFRDRALGLNSSSALLKTSAKEHDWLIVFVEQIPVTRQIIWCISSWLLWTRWTLQMYIWALVCFYQKDYKEMWRSHEIGQCNLTILQHLYADIKGFAL